LLHWFVGRKRDEGVEMVGHEEDERYVPLLKLLAVGDAFEKRFGYFGLGEGVVASLATADCNEEEGGVGNP